MITVQESQERVKAFYDDEEESKQILRLSCLSENLSRLGQILIQSGPAWKQQSESQGVFSNGHYNVFDEFKKLTSKERLSLFDALYPQLVHHLETTWNLFDRLPYQTQYDRRPFRIPHHEALEAKVFWIERFAHAAKGCGKQDIQWFACWAAHLGYAAPDALGYLFAGAIENGGKSGQEVLDILISSANGTHEIGAMGRHVVRGLLCASRPEGWEFMERMLLAAQREEGLRQVILESIDESHPQAFRRLLRIIVEHNLSRFSSAIRAFDTWFGLALESVSQKTVNQILAKVLSYLDSPANQKAAIENGTPEDAYFALWATAFDNALEALPVAIQLRQSKELERRFIATHFLAQTQLEQSFNELLDALEDEDLRIVSRAVISLRYAHYGLYYDPNLLASSDLFERLERLLSRLPHRQNALKPLVWDWMQMSLDREVILDILIDCLGERGPKPLIPYLPLMNPGDRARVARLLNGSKHKDAETMQVLLKLVGDSSSHVRETALLSMQGYPLKEEQVLYLEGLLSRRAEDLRRGIIQLLLGLPDAHLKASLKKLLNQRNESQRLAALELLRECKLKKRLLEACELLTREYTQRSNLTEGEKRFLEERKEIEKVSFANALGLMDPQNRTRAEPIQATKAKVTLISDAAVACLKSLDELVEEHRNDQVEFYRGDRKTTELLGNIRSPWMFASYHARHWQPEMYSNLPLQEVWEEWLQARSRDLRDEDGFELIRALALIDLIEFRWRGNSRAQPEIPTHIQNHFSLNADLQLNYQAIVRAVLGWTAWTHSVEGETNFILDALEESVSRIPQAEIAACTNHYGIRQYRDLPRQKLVYLSIAHLHRTLRPATWNDQHHVRLWKIVRWLDEPAPRIPRHPPMIEDALNAFQAGAATRDDLFDLFLGPSVQEGYHQLLWQFSKRGPNLMIEKYPVLREIIDACRERILEVESQRGDLPTAASAPARQIQSVPGVRNLFRLLRALGKANFERGYGYGQSRSAVLSHLIRCSYPLETDTLEDFVGQTQAHNISERRLVELAVYAPQWSRFVQQTINWNQLSEAVWWLYAHTKARRWYFERELQAERAARISEYTPLPMDRLGDGAVDIAWFHRIYAALGKESWQKVYRAAEYASGGRGHTRPRLFADAVLGKLSPENVIERIHQKRHQDSVRALGLIPLLDAKEAQSEALHRYEVMQDFLRTSKKFGSQRQASEKLAVSIGMENLARTAGYRDPQRLEWAMEVEAISDLAQGPAVLTVEDVSVSLSIDDLGEPRLKITKKGKSLKAIPRDLKKDERISILVERKQKLKRQLSRMRLSLEEAMCRGDSFSGEELAGLFHHPMLKAMVEQLVFISNNGMGFPIKNGKALFHYTGQESTITLEDTLRIAHPVDLLQNKDWHEWQHDCFVAERIQPFKQIFRELYVLTSTEKEEGNSSRRYAGQQVNPRQAMALFGTRGWVADPAAGIQKTFHDVGISVRIGFLGTAFTPAEVDGSTIEWLVFTNRDDWKPIPLESIPPRIFSEVMRDVDLVVSVAHAGGVDPEASASSIESRSALIRETCTLLNLANVQMFNHHALVNGKIGHYNVHLGSGVVHKQPGGALCIIPVHSQHRGRLFLPFVDNDPKTAEVVSKVLLLARDDQIKDPTILEQILSS
jgi:HEAT repeat protein